MTKYAALERHLASLGHHHVTMTFDEIESVIGSRLPASSSKYEAHWRGTTHGRPGGAIAAAGWRVDKIDWLAGAITLERKPTRQYPSSGGASVEQHNTASSRGPTPDVAAWQGLEERAAQYFSGLWGTDLRSRIVSVGGVAKSFDLVSSDGRFVGDAKQYKNIRTPAAKWQGIAEYVWLLQHVEAEHRFMVFGGDAIVAQRFLSRWRPLVESVTFYHLTETGHRIL